MEARSSEGSCSPVTCSTCSSYSSEESMDSSVESFPKLASNRIVGKKKKSNRWRPNVLDKLFFRELRGGFSTGPHAATLPLFTEIPSHCEISLQNVLPESAIHSNHVFLGLSRCGQFLLSYTYATELEEEMTMNEVYKYRLHWWSFVPHQKVRKVSEVMLFGNQNVYSMLYIAVCQWPMDYSRVLVYGNCQESYGLVPSTSPYERGYVTITTVPSLNKCHDCLKVAASYEEEDLAASWDSCVRFSCLKHGLTVHTSFDVVSPFPKFEPSISMKKEGTVVFNTGNFLHVLKVELEHLGSIASSVNKSCTTNSVLNSDSSETIDQNPTSVASSLSDDNVQMKQDHSNIMKSSEENLTYDDCDQETETSSHVAKVYDTRLHRKLVGLQLSPPQGISSLLDLSSSKHDDPQNRSRNLVVVAEEDFECDLDDTSANDDLSHIFVSCTGKKNFLEQDLGREIASVKLGSEDNFCRLGLDSRLFNRDFSGKNSDISASQSVMKIGGECSDLDSRRLQELRKIDEHLKECLEKSRKSDCREEQIEDVDAALGRERGKDVSSGRITRSHTSRVSSHTDVVSMPTDGTRKTDPQLMRDKARYLASDLYKEQGEITGYGSRESRVIDSTQELNITCGNVNATTSEEMVSVVTLMSPNPGTLLMVNTTDESEGNDCQLPCERRKELSPQTSSRTRRIRGGATVKLSSPLPGLTASKKAEADKIYDFITDDGLEPGCEKLSSFRRRRRAATPVHSNNSTNIHNKIAEAEKAYEFITDDGLEPGCEKLSSFRRRRLADKKYEFCEEGEDAENIVPFRLTRRRELSPRLRSPTNYLPPSPLVGAHRRRHHANFTEPSELVISGPRSPQILVNDMHLESDKVLRPLNRNTASMLLSPRDRDGMADWIKTNVNVGSNASPHNNKEPIGCDKAEIGVVQSENASLLSGGRGVKKESMSPQSNVNTNTTRCTVQLKRRYIEVDDELVSVITDIEDDDFSESTGYHCALPLEVHGAGYVQLQMISNSKAGKLMAPCVLIHQRSFDVEQFCHEIAERLCDEAGKKYWFCDDYDVEVIDVCPFSGDVICIALMRIQATIKTKGLAKSQRHPVSSIERQQYQGSCKFVWNVDSGHYSVVSTNPLHKIDFIAKDPWNPARGIARKLRENLNNIVPMHQSVKAITNELVLEGISLTKIEDLENLIELTL